MEGHELLRIVHVYKTQRSEGLYYLKDVVRGFVQQHLTTMERTTSEYLTPSCSKKYVHDTFYCTTGIMSISKVCEHLFMQVCQGRILCRCVYTCACGLHRK